MGNKHKDNNAQQQQPAEANNVSHQVFESEQAMRAVQRKENVVRQFPVKQHWHATSKHQRRIAIQMTTALDTHATTRIITINMERLRMQPVLLRQWYSGSIYASHA